MTRDELVQFLKKIYRGKKEADFVNVDEVIEAIDNSNVGIYLWQNSLLMKGEE